MIDGHRAARQSIGSMIATFLARRGFDISSFGGMLAVLGYPLSVSLSQGGLFLALLGWVLHAIG
ncbi:MAG: hypothetical protein KDK30_14305, partial [Leptospiraceae bacterium]|nr:hypothetical protein [Leptospiraceae bacterium]